MPNKLAFIKWRETVLYVLYGGVCNLVAFGRTSRHGRLYILLLKLLSTRGAAAQDGCKLCIHVYIHASIESIVYKIYMPD